MPGDPFAAAALPRRSAPRPAVNRPVVRSVPQLLSVSEVARTLGLSRSKVYQLIASGELAAYRPGGRVRVAVDAVAELLERTKL
jgi:excisionase family DNA binding protein